MYCLCESHCQQELLREQASLICWIYKYSFLRVIPEKCVLSQSERSRRDQCAWKGWRSLTSDSCIWRLRTRLGVWQPGQCPPEGGCVMLSKRQPLVGTQPGTGMFPQEVTPAVKKQCLHLAKSVWIEIENLSLELFREKTDHQGEESKLQPQEKSRKTWILGSGENRRLTGIGLVPLIIITTEEMGKCCPVNLEFLKCF